MSTPWILVSLVLATPGSADEGTTLDEISRLLERGDARTALLKVDRALLAGSSDRRTIALLRARCLFELADWPRCQSSLERALAEDDAALRKLPAAERASCLLRLALTHSRQGAHVSALRHLTRALATADLALIRRAGITIGLHARRRDLVLEHATTLLEQAPQDEFAQFARGLGRAGTGRYEEALADLRQGLRLPGATRDARFELALSLSRLGRHDEALVHLIAILERDPYDAEACYQLSRALIRDGAPNGPRLSALVMRYFGSVQAAVGPSSRAEHLASAGQAAAAAQLRSERRERLGDFAGALVELDRAVARSADPTSVLLARAGLLLRHGFVSIAEQDISRVDSEARRKPSLLPTARSIRQSLERARRRIEEDSGTPAGRLRAQLARANAATRREALLSSLRQARVTKDTALADSCARWLLSFDPPPLDALAHLIDRTGSPELLIPHLHYLWRAVRVNSSAEHVKKRLEEIRKKLRGKAINASPR